MIPLPPDMPRDWPLRDHMRIVESRPHRWCVLDMGTGPVVLLLHGAGGAGHSWRGLAPLLAKGMRVIAPDLPGQGFSRPGNRGRLGLDAMAEDLARLCADQGWTPAAVIGHSAGAALALRLAEILPQPPQAVVGVNAALGSFDGVAGWLFPILAKVLALNPLVPPIVARLWGNEARVRSLLAGTGSPLDAEGVAQYLALVRRSAHIDGTLGMMAGWRLDSLLARLPDLDLPVLLLTASGDRAVPPTVSRGVAGRMSRAEYREIAGPGHLLHETHPQDVADVFLPFLARHGIGGATGAFGGDI